VPPAAWPLAAGLGGLWGDALVGLMRLAFAALRLPGAAIAAGVLFLPLALIGIGYAIGLRFSDVGDALDWAGSRRRPSPPPVADRRKPRPAPRPRPAPEPEDGDEIAVAPPRDETPPWDDPVPARGAPEPKVA